MTNTLSAVEQAKAAVSNPYDGQDVFARLAGGTVADITPADDVVMRWHGLYRHRPQADEVFMLRLKLAGGAISAPQLAAVAEIADGVGHPQLNLTTRQDLELHRLRLADLPGVFAGLAAAELTTLGACGDQVRNVVTCPAAGLAPDDAVDTGATAQALTAAFLANADFANLPRKFKMGVCGCAQRCVPTDINDLGLVATQRADGRWGYAVYVGGGLAARPVLAAPLGVWIAPDDAVEVACHAVAIFREYGNRAQRGKARVKHLIAERGIDWFRQELFIRLGRALSPLETCVLTASRQDHLGVHPQREHGLVYVGVPVLAGRLSTAQVREIAAIAWEHGSGQVRLTHLQNLLLPDIPFVQIDEVRQRLDAIGLPVRERSWTGTLVVCTGKEFCNKSVAHTKSVARHLAARLEAVVPDAGISLRMSGCPNGCGQHAIADIGLQGTVVKGVAGPEERFDLWVGGGEAATPVFGKRILSGIAADDIDGIIVRLIFRYRQEATGELFSEYARRVLWAEANAHENTITTA